MHVKNYAKDGGDPKDTTELDLIQISVCESISSFSFKRRNLRSHTCPLDKLQLTCCGVRNWADYLPRSTWDNGKLKDTAVGQRQNLDNSDLIIPSSCCRQWWVRNIYCAHEAQVS